MIQTATDLHALLNTCPDSICALDTRGRIQFVNSLGLGFIQHLQQARTPLSQSDVLGQTWQTLAVAHTLCQVLEQSRQRAIAQGTPIVKDLVCPAWDGQDVLYQCTFVPMPAASNDCAIALYSRLVTPEPRFCSFSQCHPPSAVVLNHCQQQRWDLGRDDRVREVNTQSSFIQLASAVEQPLLEADQLAIAVQCSTIHHQAQPVGRRFDDSAHHQMEQFQTLLNYEAVQRRITEHLRSSLNEQDILKCAVVELATQLQVGCCNIFLMDQGRSDDAICITTESVRDPRLSGLVLYAHDYPEMQRQIQLGWTFQFSTQLTHNGYGWATLMLCPIIDDNNLLLGDVLLLREQGQTFSELELGLVQQVTSQCAIAIRQARLYQAVQQQVNELERLNRLKDDFLSTVSHELRSPMTNIKMATQMLQMILVKALESVQLAPPVEEEAAPEALLTKASHYVQILKDECRRETDLINDLLDLSRLEGDQQPLSLTTVDLATWLEPILVPFAERAQVQHQHLLVSMPSPSLIITTDTASLERIVTELLTNACKYTPIGEAIQLQWAEQGGYLELQIVNSGVELTAIELQHVFDRFYRVPRNDPWKYGGTGLGLALVKKLVEHLQGSIAIASTHQRVVCTVQLPLER